MDAIYLLENGVTDALRLPIYGHDGGFCLDEARHNITQMLEHDAILERLVNGQTEVEELNEHLFECDREPDLFWDDAARYADASVDPGYAFADSGLLLPDYLCGVG